MPPAAPGSYHFALLMVNFPAANPAIGSFSHDRRLIEWLGQRTLLIPTDRIVQAHASVLAVNAYAGRERTVLDEELALLTIGPLAVPTSDRGIASVRFGSRDE